MPIVKETLLFLALAKPQTNPNYESITTQSELCQSDKIMGEVQQDQSHATETLKKCSQRNPIDANLTD